MAELDYAFLAEYAKVEPGGNLTAVGASFTHGFVPTFPLQHLVSIAGRVRAKLGEVPSLKVAMETPEGHIRVEVEGDLRPADTARPYGPDQDTVGLQFAFSYLLPLPAAGLYQVHLTLDDVDVRLLASTAAQVPVEPAEQA